MEIMGLAVVIVLITIALLFTIKFVYLQPEEKGVKASYESRQLAANTINAIVQTTATQCFNHQIKKLISSCAISPASGGTIQCADGTMACERANMLIGQLLDMTLGEWGVHYNFTAPIPDYKISYLAGNCSKSEWIQPHTSPLHTEAGTIDIKLSIC